MRQEIALACQSAMWPGSSDQDNSTEVPVFFQATTSSTLLSEVPEPGPTPSSFSTSKPQPLSMAACESTYRCEHGREKSILYALLQPLVRRRSGYTMSAVVQPGASAMGTVPPPYAG